MLHEAYNHVKLVSSRKVEEAHNMVRRESRGGGEVTRAGNVKKMWWLTDQEIKVTAE